MDEAVSFSADLQKIDYGLVQLFVAFDLLSSLLLEALPKH